MIWKPLETRGLNFFFRHCMVGRLPVTCISGVGTEISSSRFRYNLFDELRIQLKEIKRISQNILKVGLGNLRKIPVQRITRSPSMLPVGNRACNMSKSWLRPWFVSSSLLIFDAPVVCKYDKVKHITVFAIKLIAYLALWLFKGINIRPNCSWMSMRGDSRALLSIKWKPVCLLTRKWKENAST